MTRASTHITLHGSPPTTQVKAGHEGVVIVTLIQGDVEQVVSGQSTRVVDELLSLAGQVARCVDWESVDVGWRANVQRNAFALAALATVEEDDVSALSAVRDGHVGEGVADDG